MIKYKSIEDAGEYLSLLDKIYGGHPGFKLFYSDIIQSLKYTISNPMQESLFFNSSNKNLLEAHVALTLDKRLPPGLAFFGFLEFPSESRIFKKMWDSLIEYARSIGITSLAGPINSSTYYQYRLSTNKYIESPPFISEPIHQNFYYDMLKRAGEHSEIKFYSGKRTKFDNIINATKESYHSLDSMGLKIEKNCDPEKELVKQIFKLSHIIFNKNLMYLALSQEEFMELYNKDKVSSYINSVYTVSTDREIIGFASTIQDNEKLIIKSIGVHPDFQSRGIGNAMVYKIHTDAINKEYKSVIYALIEEKNRVRYFPRGDADVIREYTCFKYKI